MAAVTKDLWINGKFVATERTYPLYAPYDGQQLAAIAKAIPAMFRKP